MAHEKRTRQHVQDSQTVVTEFRRHGTTVRKRRGHRRFPVVCLEYETGFQMFQAKPPDSVERQADVFREHVFEKDEPPVHHDAARHDLIRPDEPHLSTAHAVLVQTDRERVVDVFSPSVDEYPSEVVRVVIEFHVAVKETGARLLELKQSWLFPARVYLLHGIEYRTLKLRRVWYCLTEFTHNKVFHVVWRIVSDTKQVPKNVPRDSSFYQKHSVYL